jgi:hypothetical protein
MVDWSHVITALIGAAAMLILAFAAGAKEYITAFFRKLTKNIEKEKQTYTHGLQRVANYRKFIEHIASFDCVDRLIVFSGTNCGGIPDPKKSYEVKALLVWASDPKLNPERFYDFPLKLDHHYVKLILDILENGVVTVEVAKLPEHCQLKTYYSLEGVQSSRFYQLHISKTELIFISIANYKRAFTNLEERKIDLAIERIRSIMNEGS